MLISRQDQACNQASVDPFCSPSPNDTWNNGTSHRFIWNPSFPFYSASETIDLYLYYKENLRFMPIKNWTALPCSIGFYTVQVDDTWFPVSSISNQSQKQWTMYGFYLPSSINPTLELSNPDSQYPRPFNFSVMQFSKSQMGGNDTSTTVTTTATDTSRSLNQSNDMVHAFPIWAIIVLAITSATLFLMLMMTLLWFCFRRSSFKKQDADNKAIPQEITSPPLSPNRPASVENDELTPQQPMTQLLSNPRLSDASWQRRSSLLSSTNAAILGETVQRMMDSPDWDDQEERRRQLGDQLLRKELEEDQETTIKETIANRHRLQIKSP